MDEDRFNIDIRKFLKEVGVTSQREIERVVREGQLQGATLHLILSDDALDLPLRGNAHLLEELANVYVEADLIHRGLRRAT